MAMRTLLTAVLLALGCAHRAPAGRQLANWNERHPEAARELCLWNAEHPRVSDRLLVWEGNNGPRAEEVFRWAQAHPGTGVGEFAAEHPGWQDFDALALSHPRAANELLEWARRHPQAAEDLVVHQGALRFAGRRNAC